MEPILAIRKIQLTGHDDFYVAPVFADNTNVDWGYTGKQAPANWGKLSKAFAVCAEGKTQSPINIDKKVKTGPFALVIKYQSAPIIIVNNGETRLAINHVPTIIYKGHAIQLDFPQNATETLVFKNKEYYLKEFHLHTPGETAVLGQIQPMESSVLSK